MSSWLMASGGQQGAEFIHAVTDHTPGQGQDGQGFTLDLQGHLEYTDLLLRPAGWYQLLGISRLLFGPKSAVTSDKVKSRVKNT